MLSLRGGLAFFFFLVPGILLAQSGLPTDSLVTIGIRYVDENNFPQAEKYLSIARQRYDVEALADTSRFAAMMMKYAYTLYQRARFDDAISELDVLQPIVEQQQDSSRLMRIENYRGLIYKTQHQFDQAMPHYQKALSMASEIRDSVWVGILYDNIGGVYRTMGHLNKSLTYRKRALDIFENAGTDIDLSITLNNLGLTYYEFSMADRAYKYLSRSLDLAKKIGDTYRLTNAYINMGLVYKSLGNYDQALIAYQKALDYARKTGNPIKIAHTLNNLGKLYQTLGEEEKSLEYIHEGLQTLQDHGIDDPGELATLYKNIASRQLDMGEIDKASNNFYKALNFNKQVGDKHAITRVYMDMAKIARAQNNIQEAEKHAERALAMADSLNNSSLIVDANNEMGIVQHMQGNQEKSLSYMRRAYREARGISPKYTRPALADLARLFDTVESDSAVYYGKKLVETIESTRSDIGELSIHKASFFENYSDLYGELASWMLKYQDNVHEAFAMVEASRSRSLLDELKQASENLEEKLPDEVRLKKQRLTDEIEKYQTQIDTTANATRKEELKSALRDAELRYASLINEVRNETPSYKMLEYPSPITAEKAQQLVDENTAVLEYAFGDNELLIFLVTSNDIQVKQVDISEGSGDAQRMTRLVEQFRDKILAHAPEQELRAHADSLVQHLIIPFKEEIAPYDNLMIIPDKVLAYLPFEALMMDDRYLVERFNVKYAPSFTTFSLLQEEKQQEHSHERDMLAVAGSNFQGTSSSLNRGKALAPLPATLAEVDSIASKFSNAEVLKQGNFEEEFIKESLTKNYRFVHLATHGIIDEDHPNLSGLALSSPPEEASGRNDGMLRSSEIYQLNINSEMVVLSACNTGLGKMVKGEGILGLQRSFFYAGVPTVSVSLWNVYDRSTAYLMDTFYTSLLEISRNSESALNLESWLRWAGWDRSVSFGAAAPAMRQAKLEMINHPLYSHPIYWAPFIVVGR